VILPFMLFLKMVSMWESKYTSKIVWHSLGIYTLLTSWPSSLTHNYSWSPVGLWQCHIPKWFWDISVKLCTFQLILLYNYYSISKLITFVTFNNFFRQMPVSDLFDKKKFFTVRWILLCIHSFKPLRFTKIFCNITVILLWKVLT
jgi:hypothetical protein